MFNVSDTRIYKTLKLTPLFTIWRGGGLIYKSRLYLYKIIYLIPIKYISVMANNSSVVSIYIKPFPNPFVYHLLSVNFYFNFV